MVYIGNSVRSGKPLTQGQKNCIQELDVYFKMKEAEYEKILNKNYEEVLALQKKLSGMKNAFSIVCLYYRNYRLFHITLPEETPLTRHRADELRKYLDPDLEGSHHFIDDLSVCYTMYKFWLRCCRGDINVLIAFSQDIPRLENALVIEQEVRLSSTDRRII